jgi:4-hydroxybenzoate polyprenyltransferase
MNQNFVRGINLVIPVTRKASKFMESKSVPLGWRFASPLIYTVFREANLGWQFIYRDISSAVIPQLLFIVAAWNSHPTSADELSLALGRGSLYFCLFLLSFCIANQIVGIEEDRINKPDRPLVSGLVSYRGGIVRWVASMILLLVVGWEFQVLEWALLWQVCLILYNFGRAGTHWVTRNIAISAATVAQLASAWQLVTPITPLAWCWILVAASMWLFLAAVQDLRDMEGDRAINRKTFPLVFGEIPSRIMLSLGFAVWPFVTHFALMLPAGQTWYLILWDIILAAVSWSIAVRVMIYRSPQADRSTYMLFTYLYCLILLSAIFVI